MLSRPKTIHEVVLEYYEKCGGDLREATRRMAENISVDVKEPFTKWAGKLIKNGCYDLLAEVQRSPNGFIYHMDQPTAEREQERIRHAARGSREAWKHWLYLSFRL